VRARTSGFPTPTHARVSIYQTRDIVPVSRFSNCSVLYISENITGDTVITGDSNAVHRGDADQRDPKRICGTRTAMTNIAGAKPLPGQASLLLISGSIS